MQSGKTRINHHTPLPSGLITRGTSCKIIQSVVIYIICERRPFYDSVLWHLMDVFIYSALQYYKYIHFLTQALAVLAAVQVLSQILKNLSLLSHGSLVAVKPCMLCHIYAFSSFSDIRFLLHKGADYTDAKQHLGHWTEMQKWKQHYTNTGVKGSWRTGCFYILDLNIKYRIPQFPQFP